MIYFVLLPDGFIKIGHSKRLRTRMQSIAKECNGRVILLGVMPGSRQEEAKAHENFSAFRQRGPGERFMDVGHVRDFIRDHTNLDFESLEPDEPNRRIATTVYLEPHVIRALRIEKATKDVDMSDIVNDAVRKALRLPARQAEAS